MLLIYLRLLNRCSTYINENVIISMVNRNIQLYSGYNYINLEPP
nr:MAG TPA: hypothetical protein [Caudoviricetes sp.]